MLGTSNNILETILIERIPPNQSLFAIFKTFITYLEQLQEHIEAAILKTVGDLDPSVNINCSESLRNQRLIENKVSRNLKTFLNHHNNIKNPFRDNYSLYSKFHQRGYPSLAMNILKKWSHDHMQAPKYHEHIVNWSRNHIETFLFHKKSIQYCLRLFWVSASFPCWQISDMRSSRPQGLT